MIRKAVTSDFEAIYRIINDAAVAYKGVIPDDRWHEPYMSRSELQEQVEDGVDFSCFCEDAEILGVMGIQDRKDVFLVRHAYVMTAWRNKGIGSQLLEKLARRCPKPILIGTWKAASWAIGFYMKHGFTLVSGEEKEILLRKYWRIPERQVETSVVLADGKYGELKEAILRSARGSRGPV
jgi:N-acetylglutamate synthase-like GNAT family acetyltransferase